MGYFIAGAAVAVLGILVGYSITVSAMRSALTGQAAARQMQREIKRLAGLQRMREKSKDMSEGVVVAEGEHREN